MKSGARLDKVNVTIADKYNKSFVGEINQTVALDDDSTTQFSRPENNQLMDRTMRSQTELTMFNKL